ncbi:hypothetical protein MBLNU13_g04806t1 [Cladosporium sp. NU13]
MAENLTFFNALGAVVGVVKSAEEATFAPCRISCPSTPVAVQSPASTRRAFDISLNILLPLIKTEADVTLAAQRISEKLESLTASSVASQESDSSQQATTSTSSSSESSSKSSPSPVEAEPTSSVTSESPVSSSAAPALPDISRPQQSSASALDATTPPSTERESNGPIESEEPRLSSAAPVAVDQQPPASGQSTSSSHSTEAESLAAVQSMAPSVHIATTQASAAQPNGPPTTSNTTQPQQPLALALTPQPSSARPKRPNYSADQVTSSPYGLIPTRAPDDGDRLPPEIAKSVGIFQSPSYVVLLLIVQNGGYNHEPSGSKDGVPLFQELVYLDYFQNERTMVVQHDRFKDHNRWDIDIPRVSCSQYLDLYNSMIHRKPSDLSTICRKILGELETAIENRAAFYKWYQSLPPSDERVAYNPRHLAFLQMFEKLEHAIHRYLLTGRAELVRR